mmetsp:Transcript_5275/g.22422  ORF Transcript_5275/g.22422 Transcript_5275/m.22422 type:complete len:214 (+) Transcript_5275:1755-2396(+)
MACWGVPGQGGQQSRRQRHPCWRRDRPVVGQRGRRQRVRLARFGRRGSADPVPGAGQAARCLAQRRVSVVQRVGRTAGASVAASPGAGSGRGASGASASAGVRGLAHRVARPGGLKLHAVGGCCCHGRASAGGGCCSPGLRAGRDGRGTVGSGTDHRSEGSASAAPEAGGPDVALCGGGGGHQPRCSRGCRVHRSGAQSSVSRAPPSQAAPLG